MWIWRSHFYFPLIIFILKAKIVLKCVKDTNKRRKTVTTEEIKQIFRGLCEENFKKIFASILPQKSSFALKWEFSHYCHPYLSFILVFIYLMNFRYFSADIMIQIIYFYKKILSFEMMPYLFVVLIISSLLFGLFSPVMFAFLHLFSFQLVRWTLSQKWFLFAH